MKVKQLVFKFEEDKIEHVFDEQFNVVEDKKLVKTLSRENIKNGNSSLIIKSMMDLPIYDVIQVRINVAETGTFLASFDKSKIDEKVREKLLENIKTLKDDAEPTKELQVKKIKKLLVILDRFNPIYVSYKNGDNIVIQEDDFKSISNESFYSYPLLLLKKIEKTKEIHIKFPDIFKKLKVKKEKPVKEEKEPKVEKVEKEKPAKVEKAKKESKAKKEIVIDFPLFTFDYLFNGLFCLLFSFGTVASVYELLNKDTIAAFLIVISVIFLGITYFSVYSTIYKKHVEKFKGLKYWLLLYLGVGTALGIVAGYLITKFAIKTDIEINYSVVLGVSIPVSMVLSLISMFPAKLINLITSKKKK